jgi:hypothetical protein
VPKDYQSWPDQKIKITVKQLLLKTTKAKPEILTKEVGIKIKKPSIESPTQAEADQQTANSTELNDVV